jgi:aminoglycoside phosphotransferase
MAASTPPDVLQRFAERSLAADVDFSDRSWPHGEARIWAVARAGATVAFLKQHRQPNKFQAELHAYRHYVPALGAAAPLLLAVHEHEPRALLFSALDGVLADEVTWPAEVEYRLHVRAGRLLKQFHGIPVAVAERARIESKMLAKTANWLSRATAYFPEATIDWARRETEAAIAAQPPICVCHQDFGPRNWVVGEGEGVGLIDFERTTVDFQYIDWSRLWMREWLARPALRAAFFEGYGPVGGAWEATMRQLLAVYAVAGVVWATEHGDAAFAEENARLIVRLQQLSGLAG